MNTLIISANPSSKWFTHEITKEIVKIKKTKKECIEVIDLYNTELKQDFLKYENKQEIRRENIKDKTTLIIQEKIKNSEELIFIFPIWWWDMPAIMKNFFESNFGPWLWFEYKKIWKEYKKIWLLNWKKYRIIATCWENALIYKLLIPIRLIWKLNRTWFCGMKELSFHIFWNMDRSFVNKEKYIKTIKNINF